MSPTRKHSILWSFRKSLDKRLFKAQKWCLSPKYFLSEMNLRTKAIGRRYTNMPMADGRRSGYLQKAGVKLHDSVENASLNPDQAPKEALKLSIRLPGLRKRSGLCFLVLSRKIHKDQGAPNSNYRTTRYSAYSAPRICHSGRVRLEPLSAMPVGTRTPGRTK